MNIGGVTPNGVFADYLAVTMSPQESVTDTLRTLLQDWAWSLTEIAPGKEQLTYPSSSVKHPLILIAPNFHKKVDRISFSGAALEILRATTLYSGILQELTTVPVNVTRLDVALDVPLGTGEAVKRRLRAVARKGRQGKIALGREALEPQSINEITSLRPWDDEITGSVMLGKRKNRYSGVVYDKRLQLFTVHGIVEWHGRDGSIGPGNELLRYEMRTSEASLADAWDGDSLFFHMASPDLLACPSGVPPWEKRDLPPLNLQPPIERTDFEKMEAILDYSRDLDRFFELLGDNPALIPMAQRRLEARFHAALKARATRPRKIA